MRNISSAFRDAKRTKRMPSGSRSCYTSGLIRPSFIPSQEQRELRDLTRLRTSALRRANPVGESAPQNPGGYQSEALIRVDGYHGENGAADPLRSPQCERKIPQCWLIWLWGVL